jgi:hypothetical protein
MGKRISDEEAQALGLPVAGGQSGTGTRLSDEEVKALRLDRYSQPIGDENLGADTPGHGDVSSFRYGLNAMRGVGNQALNSVGNVLNIPNAFDEVVPPVGNALKGLADTPEQQQQNPGNAVGKFLFDMGIQIPTGGAGGLIPKAPALGRAIASGGVSGATADGDAIDRVKSAGLGMLGSLGGEAGGMALSTLMKPFSNVLSPTVKTIADNAETMGIPLSAAQRTGNKSLQYADSALDYLPSSSSGQQAFKDKQREVWTKALYKEGGHNYDPTFTNNLGEMKKATSAIYKDVTSRNDLIVDDQFLTDLAGIEAKYGQILPVDQKRIVSKYIDDLSGQPTIPGHVYQNTRSKLDKQAKGMRQSDPFTSDVLKEVRSATDNAMARNLSPDDKALWETANKNWMIQKHIEKAINPTTQEISPKLLINEMGRRSPDIVKYGEGPQGFADIAKVGKQFIGENLPNSGTAQRAFMMKLLTNPLASITQGGAIGLAGAPVTAISSLVLPKLASNLMNSQTNQYFAKGVKAYTPERQKIAEALARMMGVAGTNQ